MYEKQIKTQLGKIKILPYQLHKSVCHGQTYENLQRN